MKNILKYLLLIHTICIVLSSCQENTNKSNSYSLQPGEKRIIIPIDDNTSCYSMSMFSYITPEGIPYLSYENEQTYELNFYRLDSCKLSHKIKIAMEGPDAVGRFIGHTVIDLDNILIFNQFKISKINKSGKILDKYDLITDTQMALAHPPTSKVYAPMILQDSSIYLYQALKFSDNNFQNPEFNENVLSFRRMDLIEL